MENERKNTDPAVALHNGPKGTKRLVSKDGKYTANKGTAKAENYYLTQELEYNDDVILKSPDFRTSIARESLENTVLKNYAGLANPSLGERLVIQVANPRRDKHSGIDYRVGIQNKYGKFLMFTAVDSKIDPFYTYTENPAADLENEDSHIFGGNLSLYHYIEGDEDKTPGSGMNLNHQNDIYNFIFPKESKENPKTLDELETINIDRADMDIFLDDFVTNNKSIMKMFAGYFYDEKELFNSNVNKFINSTREKYIGKRKIIQVDVPIPNTNYFATFEFYRSIFQREGEKRIQSNASIILPKEFLKSDKNYFPTSTYDRTLYK